MIDYNVSGIGTGAEAVLGAKFHICDMCGERIEREKLRYTLKMRLFAAYDTLEIKPADIRKDYEEEIRNLVEEMKNMDPRRLEEDISKQFGFDLCRPCQQRFLKDPLGRTGDRESLPAPFDVDEFLRRIREG